MKVLLSIKPRYASMIFSGIKRFEYRRAVFAKEDIVLAYVYASLPVGGVVGEFRIGRILSASPSSVWRQTKTHAGISQRAFLEYFRGIERAHAIEITDYTLYDIPLHLTAAFGVSPPQSFVYVDTPCEGTRRKSARSEWRRTKRSKLFHAPLRGRVAIVPMGASTARGSTEVKDSSLPSGRSI